jgi:hypothetical protein
LVNGAAVLAVSLGALYAAMQRPGFRKVRPSFRLA